MDGDCTNCGESGNWCSCDENNLAGLCWERDFLVELIEASDDPLQVSQSRERLDDVDDGIAALTPRSDLV